MAEIEKLRPKAITGPAQQLALPAPGILNFLIVFIGTVVLTLIFLCIEYLQLMDVKICFWCELNVYIFND